MLSLPAFQFPAQISLLPQYRFQPHHISHNRPHKAQPSNLHIIKASSTAKIDVDLRPTRERERGFDALLRQWRRPKPITTIRKRLDMDFAVLLMRSGYEAVESLRFCPMDQYQREFFHLRSLEWETFLQDHPTIPQGHLDDPNYFDFISFAQFATTTNMIRDCEQNAVFTENYNAQGDTRVLKRDLGLWPDGKSLVSGYGSQVGGKILEKGGFELGTKETGVDGIKKFVEGVVGGFVDKGYGWDGGVEWKKVDNVTLEWTIRFEWPAVLWGNRWLDVRRDLKNDYDAFVVERFCEDCGWSMRHSTRFDGETMARDCIAVKT